jgi:hypothetical protein
VHSGSGYIRIDVGYMYATLSNRVRALCLISECNSRSFFRVRLIKNAFEMKMKILCGGSESTSGYCR